jgi:hypothetical protein
MMVPQPLPRGARPPAAAAAPRPEIEAKLQEAPDAASLAALVVEEGGALGPEALRIALARVAALMQPSASERGGGGASGSGSSGASSSGGGGGQLLEDTLVRLTTRLVQVRRARAHAPGPGPATAA